MSIYSQLLHKEKTLAVIGLGYVGLPLALTLAKHFKVLGYDINPERVALMRQGIDPSRAIGPDAFQNCDIHFSARAEDLNKAHFFIVAVPTDIDEHKKPDLGPLKRASLEIGHALKKGDFVVFESTVFPGCTEETCLPILEKTSQLTLGSDFKLGYSPERISPGEQNRDISQIVKIVSASDQEALEQIAQVYGQIVRAGIHRAPSIRVAEAAKVVENTQRDLNISLMNELAIIFDRMDIDTHAVIEAAGTKWNFQKFYPGLVGGHCISVDPYYLLYQSEQMGYVPQVILSGRRINDAMPAWVAKKLVQLLLKNGKSPNQARVLVLGITFKENVTDIRNSKVANLVRELQDYSIRVDVTDPLANPKEVMETYGITLIEQPASPYDAIAIAVAHDAYKKYDAPYFISMMNPKPILIDLKGIYQNSGPEIDYWKP